MNSSVCKHLRTKVMFTGATPAEAFAEKDSEHATPCHCWCNLTQTVTGPDDRPAHKDTCKPDRACFEE